MISEFAQIAWKQLIVYTQKISGKVIYNDMWFKACRERERERETMQAERESVQREEVSLCKTCTHCRHLMSDICCFKPARAREHLLSTHFRTLLHHSKCVCTMASETQLGGGDEEKWANREFVLREVSKDGALLRYASKELQGDHEVVLMAVSNCGMALRHATEELGAHRHRQPVRVLTQDRCIETSEALLSHPRSDLKCPTC